MALIFRLVGNNINNQFLKQKTPGLLKFVRPVTLKGTTVESTKEEGYDERNMRLKRPISPHLSIYSPQLNTVLSISQRFSGIAISAYAIGFGIGALVLPESIPHYIEQLQSVQIGATNVALLKFLIAFPMTYHFWNGIRFLTFDTGNFLTNKGVNTTGYVMLAFAISSATALTFM